VAMARKAAKPAARRFQRMTSGCISSQTRHKPLGLETKRCALRPGNVHSADGWRVVLEPVVALYWEMMKRLYFRGDAAFAIYEFLEAEGLGYLIRLKANSILRSSPDTRSSAGWATAA